MRAVTGQGYEPDLEREKEPEKKVPRTRMNIVSNCLNNLLLTFEVRNRVSPKVASASSHCWDTRCVHLDISQQDRFLDMSNVSCLVDEFGEKFHKFGEADLSARGRRCFLSS